jgi:uridine phosphorylase
VTFPNFSGKHSGDSMFSTEIYRSYLKRIGAWPKEPPPHGVIICYQASLMRHVLANHPTTRYRLTDGEVYLLDDTGGRVAVAGRFGIGAPAAVSVLEALAMAGVRRFMSIGTSGTLQKDIKVGDLIVCDRAIRDEGTSHHYLPHAKYAHASEKMTAAIIAALKRRRRKYVVGTSWTVDAPFRETVKEARHYQKEGVATVEMEASALFAVAEYRGLEMGAILTISDSLAELVWQPKFHLKKTKQTLEALYRVALEVLLAE